MTIFDIIDDILKHKTGKYADHPNFEKIFSPYFVMRYLSMCTRTQKVAFELNNYHNMKYISNKDIYLMLIKKTPVVTSYIQYIKNPKPENDDLDNTA
jgi:hypothetical protein